MTPLLLVLAAIPVQDCISADFDPGAVSAEEAFRSGTRSALEEVWNPDWGRGIAILSTSDSSGLRVRAHLESGDSNDTSRIAALLDDGLVVSVAKEEPLRLLIHDGDDFVFRTVRQFTTCAPRFRNRSGVANQLGRIGRRLRVSQTLVIRARLWIDVEGRVGPVEIEQSSGSIEVDAAVLEAARGWRFEPARNEGIPVAVWLAFPITLRAPG